MNKFLVRQKKKIAKNGSIFFPIWAKKLFGGADAHINTKPLRP